jgi:hypothetical protein
MGEGRDLYRVLVGKPEGKRPLERPRRRWTDGHMEGWMGDGLVDRWMGDGLVDGWRVGWVNG